jgi:hypothetical protein
MVESSTVHPGGEKAVGLSGIDSLSGWVFQEDEHHEVRHRETKRVGHSRGCGVHGHRTPGVLASSSVQIKVPMRSSKSTKSPERL